MIDSLALAEMELAAVGSTQVLVVLDAASLKSSAGSEKKIASAFRAGEVSQLTALATSSRMRGRDDKPHHPLAAYRLFPNLGIMIGTVDKAGFNDLKAATGHGVDSLHSAGVLSLIRPNKIKTATALTTTTTWGIKALKIPKLWDQGLTGKGVLVGHLDTGVDGKHPALKTAIGNFVEMDLMGFPVKPEPFPFDSDDHGTHTAATIAGRAVRGKSVGVAPGALLASALVIEGGQVLARVAAGLEWALDHKVRIVSMSLGIRGFTPFFTRIVTVLRANGVLPVFAAGNEGPGTSRSPGNYSEAFSVGAVDFRHLVADFSSSQQFQRPDDPLVPDVTGPGVGIISAKPGKGYQSMDGTSMATPHIAGLAALLLEAKPDATVAEIEIAIRTSCRPVDPTDEGRAAAGLPDATVALKELLS